MLLEWNSLETDFEANFIVFTIFKNSKMAAPMDGPKPNDISHCQNALVLMNMHHIASADINNDLVNNYFVIRPIGNDESDSDLSVLTTHSWKSLLLLDY